MTTEDYGATGCCPGHDKPYIRKWSGTYSGKRSKKLAKQSKKIQNRMRRRLDKENLMRL